MRGRCLSSRHSGEGGSCRGWRFNTDKAVSRSERDAVIPLENGMTNSERREAK
jgi:hypothetical protein